MRIHLIGLILLAGLSAQAPAHAQQPQTVERRVDRLEQQLRAVQRRVFPNGNVQPEVGDQPAVAGPASAGGDALTSLTQRVDALETQLRALTGQIEENGYRTRQLEEQVARLRTDLTARLDRLDPPAAVTPNVSAPPIEEPRAEPPVETPPEPVRAAAPASAEEAYNAGYRLWDRRQYAEAQATLEAAATRYPTGRWISWIRNLQGRAYLDDGKPATAARILLANYTDNPRGDRAADSLYYLGEALTRLNRRTEACRVYDELARVYPTMRDQLRSQLPGARRTARCGGE
ncbi:MAG TPA: tetratricopeptide repeat protein [Allosphingosinicella sp.]|jgi:TolA-binding protein|nr:tetratricopeptide repeat protein [Allosphingosinicella sp.]